MSTPHALPLPRWVDTLRTTLTHNLKENKDLVSYALASSDVASNQPRTRYVVHRGFANERRNAGDGSRNLVHDDDGNELISDKLVVTTDGRSPKAAQLAASPAVELAWWLSATQHQFRIAGKAYLLPSPSFSSSSSSSTSSSSPSSSAVPFPPFPGDKLAPYPGFSWEDERIRQFRKLSAELRASFCRPVPGTKLSEWGGKLEELPQELPEGLDEATGDDEQKKQIEQALEHFVLIVIDPEEVDLVDLGSTPNTRTQWKLTGGKWSEAAVVP
ncbi:hypothetical protein JCM21900_005305 [Sporobolomyces salmonicolor]